MSVTQYIGARYVPLFADPIDWDINSAYEPLTIVYYQGNSYTSKQAVPTNVDITNTDYWVITGNYNAQIEQYRREVQTFDGRITENAQAIADEVTERMQEDTAIRALISTLNGELATEKQDREAADTQIRTDFAQDLADEVASLNETIGTDVDRLEQQDAGLSARISTLEQPYIAVIGDSFSDADTEWPTMVKNRTGYNLLSGATAGGTFGENTGQKHFLAQLNTISENANWGKVQHLIVYGGVNDWSDLNKTSAQTLEDIATFVARFRSLAHRPKITFVFGNCGWCRRSFTRTYLGYPTYVNEVVSGIRQLGYDAVPAYAWLLGFRASEVYNSDNLHPNDKGSKIIASFMTAIINGSYNGFVRQITASPTSSNFTGKLVINIYDTYASAAFKAQPINAIPSTGTGLNGIFNLSDIYLWFGTNESQNAKLNLLHRSKILYRILSSTGALNLIEGYSNIAVTSFGYTSNVDLDLVAGFNLFVNSDTLVFE